MATLRYGHVNNQTYTGIDDITLLPAAYNITGGLLNNANYVWNTTSLSWVKATQSGGGSGGLVQIQDSLGNNLSSTSGSLNVNVTAGGGGGTQYAQGTTNASPTGTVAFGKNPSNILNSLITDASGNLIVNIATGTVATTGTYFQATQPVSIATMPSTPVTGTFWPATQPVSGTVTTTPPSNASTSVSQFGGNAVVTGTGIGGLGIPRVTVSSDSFPASQVVTLASTTITGSVATTGTYFQTTQPVSIATMPSTPVTGTFWQTTQPVSFTQPALVAGSAIIGTVKLVDTAGTNLGTIKAASTAIASTDTALSVGLHPTSPLPTGSNVIGAVTQSGTWNVGTITTLPSLATGANTIGAVNIAASQTLSTVTTLGTLSAITAGPTIANGFFVRNTDGTNIGAVKAASTAAVATDPAQVVAISPNNSVAVTQATPANLQCTATPIAVTKGTQGATGFTVQDLKDAGRNQTNYFMASQVLSTATEALQSLTGYKSGAAVVATTTPAVVTTGKTYRIQRIALTYVGVATSGAVQVNIRANTGGVVAITSPLVDSFIIGEQQSATASVAGAATTVQLDIPDGMEFAAGTGIGVTVLGLSSTGTAAATGYAKVSIGGYEY